MNISRIIKSKLGFPLFFLGIIVSGTLATSLLGIKQRSLRNIPPALKKSYICKDCNIVMIDIDGLRADALPCQGYHRNTAPNLCGLAAKGVLLTRNFSNARITLPSIVSTLTSLYPSAHNVRSLFRDTLNPEIPTIAGLLKSRGYETYWVGPSGHYVITPENGGARGYDKRLTEIDQQNMRNWTGIIERLEKTEQPFFIHFYTEKLHMPYYLEYREEPIKDLPNPGGFPDTWEKYQSSLGDYLVERYSDIFTDKAFADHPELFRSVGPDKKNQLLQYFNSLSSPTDQVKDFWVKQHAYVRHAANNPAAIEYMRMLYDTKISSVDKKLSQLLSYIQSSGLSRNTIVVIYASHGEEFADHGGFSHGPQLYNELLHTPLIFSIPGQPPRQVESTTSNVDILPTLMEIIGAPIPPQAQGKSLIELMDEGVSNQKRYAIAELDESTASIQDDQWKLIAFDYSNQASYELYNLQIDPSEKIDLAVQEEKIAEELLALLRQRLDESKGLFGDTSVPPWIEVDTRDYKKLIEEGYF